MLYLKSLFLKPLFIIIHDWNAKIDFYDEHGYWPGEKALEIIHGQSESAWKLYTQRHLK